MNLTLETAAESTWKGFTLAERDRRWRSVRDHAASAGLDCTLVPLCIDGRNLHLSLESARGTRSDCRYLTLLENAAVVMPTDGRPPVVITERGGAGNTWVMEPRAANRGTRGGWGPATAEALLELGFDRARVGVVGLKGGQVTHGRAKDGVVNYTAYAEVQRRLPNARFEDATNVVGFARYVKGEEELDALRRGAVIAAAGIEEMIAVARPGLNSPATARTRADGLADAFRKKGATVVTVAPGASEQNEMWELRHAASPILAKLDPTLKSMQFIEDVAVPIESLAEYVRGVRLALDQRGVRGVIFGHAGDSHVHVNPLIDTGKPGWRDDVEGLLADVVALTARLGGTLAGEHGDGRLRTPLMARVWTGEALRLFALVKSAFDPRGILNPGVKVPLAGQKPLEDIKYDPALAPLPIEARSALDKVSDQRAYSTLRLSLIPGSE